MIDSVLELRHPPGLGRMQGWGFWADTMRKRKILERSYRPCEERLIRVSRKEKERDREAETLPHCGAKMVETLFVVSGRS